MKAFTYLCSWLLLAVLAGHSAAAQEMVPHLKFGKPVQEELTMTTYAPDTTAAAVVLCSLRDVYYRWGVDDFRLFTKNKVRIKVLKPEGVEEANISIQFYKPLNRATTSKVLITGLTAVAYNMEEGQMVATKMKKDAVFEERVNNSYMSLKFTIPQVKVGTLFEYEYEVQSDYYYNIDSWKAQTNIPVFYTAYNVSLPEYFQFNIDNPGWIRLENTTEDVNISFNFPGGERLNALATEHRFVGRDMPALKKDNYTWCLDDYCTQVNLELRTVSIPSNMYYRSYARTWENIEEQLKKSDNFGPRMRMSNPLKAEMAALNIPADASVEDKVTALFRLLKQRVKWNGSYALYGYGARKVLKEGTGDNADINFIFMSMLRDANIQAYPVLMSRRNMGRLPYTHPSVQRLNTFVVGVQVNDTTISYIDGSGTNGTLNCLAPVLLTDRARLMRTNAPGIWVDLMASSRSTLKMLISGEVSPKGVVTATRQTQYGGLYATELQRSYQTAGDSAAYVNRLNSRSGIRVTALSWDGKEGINEPVVVENMTFERKSRTIGGMIYVNPFLFMPYNSNPFRQAERRLPVEFSHPLNVQCVVNLKLPEGYVIDELPQSQLLRFGDNSVTCRFRVNKQGEHVLLRCDFTLARTLYLPDEYSELQDFWNKMVEQRNSYVVLKRAEAL
jgi:hypothetical protein